MKAYRAFAYSSVLVAASMCLTGCGVGTYRVPATSDSPQGIGVFTYSGKVPTEMDFKQAGLTLLPPASLIAKVGPDVARAACLSGEAVCWPGDATTWLAVGTIDGAGTINPDNSVTPLFQNALVYATVWPDMTCRPVSNGPDPWATASPVVSHDICTSVSVVDALTGKALYSFSAPKD